MARARTVFACNACGAIQSRWMGKCPDCGEWDALEEQRVEASASSDPQRGVGAGALNWAASMAGEAPAGAPEARPLGDLGAQGDDSPRLPTGVGEFDRVLGGGVVPGSVVLVGGDPGIGKSTLLLQCAGAMARGDVRTLYVASEESARQVQLRARRLNVPECDGLLVLADTNLARIVEQARRTQPQLVIVDSIQMIYRADVDAAPGTVSQLRRCVTDLVYLAKATGVAILLVGHVTKEGSLAGPKVVEHMVDAVLSFEGDRYHAHRVVRASKNRFGDTLEIGIFEMTGAGLREAPEGASVPAGAHDGEARPGSVVCPTLAGARCALVEIQALCADGFLGSAKRRASGLDANRLAMIIAILEQHGGLRLADRDVFASAVGGLRVVEPATDLALALAIAGAHQRRALEPTTAVVGEVGLGGEIRSVPQMTVRLREAARLGYTRVVMPSRMEGVEVPDALRATRVGRIGDALEALQ